MPTQMIPRPRATSLRQALFDPGTVIGPDRLYWLAGTILIGVGLVISALPFVLMMRAADFGAFMQASMLGQISYILIFPWFCLIGARLRDAGHNPIWFIGILIGWSLIGSIIMGGVMVATLFEDMPALLEDLEAQGAVADETDMAAALESQGRMMASLFSRVFWPVHIISGLSSFAVLGLLALLPSRTDGNEFLWRRGFVAQPPPDAT